MQSGLTIANPCASGTLAVQSNGNPVAVGQSLPAGRGRATTTFTNCNLVFFSASTVTGSLTYDYDWTLSTGTLANVYPAAGVATVTANALRTSITASPSGPAADHTLNGPTSVIDSAVVAADGSFVLTMTYEPAAGSTLTNNATSRAVQFVSGRLRSTTTLALGSGGLQLRSAVVEYLDLQYTLAGQTYILAGNEILDISAAGAATASGTIQLLGSGRTPLARIVPLLPSGYNVEAVTGEVAPF
jgi:hypothetical protein